MGTKTELRDAALGLELAIAEAACDEVVPHEWGRAFRSPTMARVWDANFVLLRQCGLALGEVAARVEAALADTGCPKQTVWVEDEADGRRLAGLARAAPGWEAETVGYMARREETEREAMADVREVPLAEITTLRAELSTAVLEDSDAEEIDQLLEFDRRIGVTSGDRWFAAPAVNPQACCRLQRLDGLAQIESVNTLPAARKRGLAQSVVLAALVAAVTSGDREIFIAVDAEDTPKRLYEKLGFAVVGEATVLRHLP